MFQELVSVIVVTYNRGYIIGAALESLRKQEYHNFEVIVVDDGSEDETADIVKQFSDLNIKYIKLEKNQGQSHARNVGLEHAQGKFIAFLDSDNEYLPQNLSIKMKMINDSPQKVGFVFGRFLRIWDEKEEVYPPVEMDQKINDDLKKVMLRVNVIDTNTVVIKKECFEKVGTYDEDLPRLIDWDMHSRILFDGGYEAVYCDIPLCINKIQKDSLSMNKDRYLVARTKLYKKRLNDYKKYYDVADIVTSYAFDEGEFKDISISRRLSALSELGFSENEWDDVWKRKIDSFKRNNKNLATFNKWVNIEEKGYRIAEWLKNHNFNKVAVYGYGYLGKHLVHELEADSINIEFILDKSSQAVHPTLKICHDLNEISTVDVIIVTAVYYYEVIREELEKVTLSKIVSLWDILNDLDLINGNT